MTTDPMTYSRPGAHLDGLRARRAAAYAPRVLLCRSCGHDTGIPGATFCDACRLHRLPSSDVLLSDVDRARLSPPDAAPL